MRSSTRWQALVPIRCRGPIHFYSARDGESGEPRVVVTAARASDTDARARLGRLVQVQALAAGERVPAIVAHELAGEPPWVALDCDAVADLETAAEYIRHGGDKPPYALGAALGKALMETLVRTHTAGVCLGSLATANVLLSSRGKLWLVGFGLGPLADACIAPEVAAGGEPTPGADVFAVMLFVRSLIVMSELPPALARVFAGRPLPEDGELMRLVMSGTAQVLAATPAQRPDLIGGLDSVRTMWRLLDIVPDEAGFSAWAARAIAPGPEPESAAPTTSTAGIRIGRDAEWLEVRGTRFELASRRALRRILCALAEARRDRAGSALMVDDLLRAGWPGEDPLPDAGSNRVYVAISTLRKLGIGEALQRWDGGYRIDPQMPCAIEV
jgi:hypothetical protein